MTADQFAAAVALAEARANLRWGAIVNRRLPNAGRAGDSAEMRAALVLLGLEPLRLQIERDLAREIDALEVEFYGSDDEGRTSG